MASLYNSGSHSPYEAICSIILEPIANFAEIFVNQSLTTNALTEVGSRESKNGAWLLRCLLDKINRTVKNGKMLMIKSI